MDNMTEYEKYRQRWLAVPGDHGPGRLLDVVQWRAFYLELAELSSRTDNLHDGTAKRIRQLQRALLVDPEA